MKILVIAPHPDDELLGCGGTLLRRKSEGAILGWVIMTKISEDVGWSKNSVQEREYEIEQVRKGLGVQPENLFQLGFPTTKLDTFPMGELIAKVSEVFQIFQPDEVFIPHQGDVHSDHRITFETVSACTKWFRYPSVKRVLAYETLSETEFSLDPSRAFQPNVFVDISPYLEQKIELLKIYSSELGAFPFPRSETAIRALAQFRGSSSGFESAEGFKLLTERNG
ncbi:MAG: PIG-L family deacetylase [Nitrospinae bacterium]|nr:PIG-L family deacetylase [Nitrospinota bacterium]